MRAAPAVMLWALIAPAPTDVKVTTLMSSRNQYERSYGTPEPVDLSAIAYNGESYQKRNVLTRGILDILVPGRFLSLREGAATVLLLPMDANAYVGMAQLAGRDVDVTGVVRVLPTTQSVQRCGLESKCNDPLLPELPNAEPALPRVSITAVSVSDRGTGMGRGAGGGRSLADTGLEAAAADGKPVRAIGQFRGANLCRDLPDTTRRLPTDWVLLTSEGTFWVTGRRPEGKGFRLDPGYRADTSRWLEVGGRVEVAGASRYLKASSVAMIPRPKESEDAPCPP